MPPKRTSTTETPAITLDAIRQLTADFTAALEAQTMLPWQPMGIEQANQITWTELKRLLTNKYCPRTEIKKMEDEFYGLTVNGIDASEEIFEGTEEKVESTAEQKESSEEQAKGEIATQASQTSTQTPSSMIFGDDETIATLLIHM
ncbi:hypothetical protein Tco_0100731, partial [Tanacetum coccineum]